MIYLVAGLRAHTSNNALVANMSDSEVPPAAQVYAYDTTIQTLLLLT